MRILESGVHSKVGNELDIYQPQDEEYVFYTRQYIVKINYSTLFLYCSRIRSPKFSCSAEFNISLL